MRSDVQITEKIKEIAKDYFSDADVMLFGSRATKTANNESDYDVLIITSQSLPPQKKTPIRTQ